MGKCFECGSNLATTTNYNESGKEIKGHICPNEACPTHRNGYEEPFRINIENLKAINPTEFCNRLGNTKAIQQNSQTRTKKRHIDKIEQALSVLHRLGFKVTLKAKKTTK